MIVGARKGKFSVLRRFVASAMARDLGVFVVPGPEIALVNGLDIEAAGMQIVASPRHASVLLVVGDIPAALREAAAVIYAQMMRPRVLFVLGSTNSSTDLSPLPVPDIVTGVSQQDLIDGVYQLRINLTKGAFHPKASDFDAPILQIRIEYTCSMHPEIIRDEPGSCPKCGMDLIQREAQASAVHNHTEHNKEAHGDHSGMDHGMDHNMNHETSMEYTCPMHPEVVQNQPGSCPECGMNLEPREKSGNSNHEQHHMEHETQLEYTCPMHPEVVQSKPGSCPKCGMNLESRDVVQVESNHKQHHQDNETQLEYTCPMHPEVVENEPGSCPKCGMNLEPHNVAVEYICPMHPEVIQNESGSCLKCGMNLEPHHVTIEYTCPMHPEVVENEPGSCPKCGMSLEPRHVTIEYTCPMHPEVVENEPGSCPKCGMNLELRNDIVEYTCPMHPEVVQNESGSCLKCGMNLEPRHVTVEYTCPMHPEVIQSEPGSCPKCGMNLEPRHVTVEYTCPMHPEVVENEPGSCPKCGMNLEPRDSTQHHHTAMESDMDHSGMEMGFMSMIEMTKDLPRSGDGLPMEWIDVPFGPFFPGLPGGLLLMLTLDGDTVAGSSVDTLVGNGQLLIESTMDIKKFVERLGILEPLAPICYQVLASLAIENAAGVEHDKEVAKARVVAMERERILSHLGWLVLFGQQTGYCWLLRHATRLKRDFLRADMKHIPALKTAVNNLIKRLLRTPLLKSRTSGIGKLIGDSNTVLLGPVARASGMKNDARSTNKTYTNLGFTAASGTAGDARARLMLRLDEICYSLELIEKVGFTTDFAITVTAINDMGETSGTGEAVIETARGLARLQLRLDQGQVVSAHLETPSTQHLALIEQLTAQQELGDALVAVGSLDLSPWEIRS